MNIHEFLDRYAETPTANGCRYFKLQRDRDGYGHLTFKQKGWPAHRFAYFLAYGSIPEGHLICHHCDCPPCVEPTHLFAGTPKDNMRDAVAKGRHFRLKTTHCPRGHPYDAENTKHDKRRPHRFCRTCMREKAHQYANNARAAAGLPPRRKMPPRILTIESVRKIKAWDGSSMTLKELAKQIGISYGHAANIRGGVYWKDVAP